jgi:hypothetical protein
LTVTRNVQVTEPQELVAVAVTVVVPTANSDPDGMEYVTDGAGEPVALAPNETGAPHVPGVLETTMFAGQEIAGGEFTWNEPAFVAVSFAEVAARTEKAKVPPGVAAVLVRVRTAVLDVALGTKEIEAGENAAVTPLGSADVTLRSTVNVPELPPPLPRFTVTT